MPKENKHNDNTDPGNKIISVVDTTGQSGSNPSSAIPATVAKSSVGEIVSVHGVVPGTTIVFDNQRAK